MHEILGQWGNRAMELRKEFLQPNRPGIRLWRSWLLGRWGWNRFRTRHLLRPQGYWQSHQTSDHEELLGKPRQPLSEAAITNSHRSIITNLWHKVCSCFGSRIGDSQTRSGEGDLPPELVDQIDLALISTGLQIIYLHFQPDR